MAPEAGKGVILVLAVPGQRPFARQKGQNLRRGDRIAGGIPVGVSEEVTQEVRPGRELRAMGLAARGYIARSPRAASCQPLQIESRHLAKRGEIDLGVDRGGGRVAVPEKVPDHLHRHALIQKMLGRGMPQGMRAASAGDDADACQAITDDLAEGLSAERPDGRVRCEEEAAPEARRPDFPYVAENGIADAR